MTELAAIVCSRLSLPQLAGLSASQRQRLLGVTCIGGPAEAWHGELPVQNVDAPLLGWSGAAVGEVWYSATRCRSGEAEGIRFRGDENVLYGVVDVMEADFALTGDGTPLQQATADAYRRIFRLLDAEGYPQLWRAWNYLADINGESHGLERYRQFNIGRETAFADCGRLERYPIPPACALGVIGGPLTIAFMAGRTAPQPLENPRQVSAYRYPADYGPRSPTFSRAALARLPGQELLFVSGTASIVGHQTMHVGDVAGQTRETVANIAAVLAEANRASLTQAYDLGELSYRAYLRHAEDLPRVRALLDELLGPRAAVVYVQADICRADLLMEVEAMASHALGNC
jgi:enamine deaminase RidA (YjgF/YER057c/UK114 family)